MSAPYAIVENKHAAVVTVRFTGAPATAENFQQYLDEVEQLYDRREPIALIFNAEQAVLPKLAYQQQQAEWLKEKDALMRNYCRGTAYVIQKAVIRWVLKAIFSLQGQPVPYTVVSTQEAAEEWARKQLGNN